MIKLFKFLFFCLLINLATKSFAQNVKDIPISGDWESAGVVFQDENVSVEIEFKLSKESCDTASFGNSNNLFRYLITGHRKPLGIDKYLTFKIVYQDCFGRLICKTNNLNIGNKRKNDVWDGVQPISDPNSDNFFRGSKLIIPFMEVRTSLEKDPSKDSECYKKTISIPSGAKSKKPEVVSQTTKIESFQNESKPKTEEILPMKVPVSKSKKSDLRIKGPQGDIVKGQKIRLELSDPGDNEWNWYEEDCNGTLLKTGSSFLDIIVLESTTFYAKPIVKISNKEICLNYHIFVDSTSSLSVPPTSIVANNKGIVCKGDTAKLYPLGGNLGTDATWTWFEKGNSTPIFMGDTLKVVPEKSTSFIVKAKGKYNETEAVETFVTVHDFDFPNRKLVFYPNQALCPNQKVQFKVEGSPTQTPMIWDWFDEKGNMLSQGTQSLIFYSPVTTEIYATYRGCSEDRTYSRTYEVNTGSTLPSSYILKQIGSDYNIELNGGDLKSGSKWVIYDQNKKMIYPLLGNNFISKELNRVYLVRAEGNCDTTNYYQIKVSEKNKKSNRFYVNFGVSIMPKSPKLTENTLSGTIGVLTSKGGWYFTVKKDLKEDIADYVTSNTAITNFPGSSGSYYLYNGDVYTNRFSAILGIHKKIVEDFYWNIGAGYGKRDVLWGVNLKSTTNGAFQKKSYALNQNISSSGLELNTGFTISIAPLNFRIDGSFLTKDFKGDNLLAEFSIGLGITF